MEGNSEVAVPQSADEKFGKLAAMLQGREDPEPENVEETPSTEVEAAAPPSEQDVSPQEQPAEDPAELKRRLAQLEQSYSEARRHIQEKGEQFNRLQTELVAKEVLLEEIRKGSQSAQQTAAPNPWQAAGIDDLQTSLLAEPERVLEIVERKLSEKYDSRLAAERQQIIAEIEDRNTKRQQFHAVVGASERAREELGFDMGKWQSVLNTVAPMILSESGEEGLYDPNQYVAATKRFIEQFAPQAQPSPKQGNPPGSKRGSVASAPPTDQPKLAASDKVLLDQFKRTMPFLPEDYEQRVAQRLAERRRNR